MQRPSSINVGFLLVAAYVLTGKLGLLFASGGGYASALFPPTGIALAFVIAYGNSMLAWVFMGAMFLNFPFASLSDGVVDAGLVRAVGIAAGSTLQSYVAASLARKYAGTPVSLESGREVIRFVAVALISCFTNSTLSTVHLYTLGDVATPDVFFVWGTWWVGDFLGIVLIAPVVLSLIGEPNDLWRKRSRSLALSLGLGLLFIMLLVKQTDDWERDQSLFEFRTISQRIGDQFLAQLSEKEAFVEQLAAVMSASHPISKEEFSRFAATALRRFPDSSQAIVWASKVGATQHNARSQKQKRQSPEPSLFPFGHDSPLESPGMQSESLPVVYAEPLGGNESAIGFNIAVQLQSREVVERSRVVAQTVGSPLLNVTGLAAEQKGMLLARWVSEGGSGPGLALVVLRMGDFMRHLVADADSQVMVRLYDLDAGRTLVFDGYFGSVSKELSERILNVGQRSYLLQTQPTKDYMALHRSWQTWILLVGGLAVLGLLNLAMLLASARTYRIETLVRERTSELEVARREAERAGNLLREAVDSIAQGFTIYDESDRLALCNETYLKFYETSRDLIVPGRTFEEIVRTGAERGQYQDAIGRVDEWVKGRVQQHQNANGEVIEQKLGDGRWLMVVEFKTRSGYIVGNRVDITELKRAAAALEEMNAQLNALFTLSPDGFITFNSDRRVQYASAAFCHLTGLEEAAVVGQDEESFSSLLAGACVPSARFRGIASMVPHDDQNDGGKQRRDRIELSGPGNRVLEVGLRLSNAQTVSKILYFRDITYETEVDRLKSEFLSTAAHELRTPMASIYGFAEVLLTQDLDEATRSELLTIVFRQSELMAKVINELLDIARIEARRGKDFVLEKVSVEELVAEVVSGYKIPVGRDSVLVIASGSPHYVRVDRRKMQQVITNLLSNAYKYSPDGGQVAIRFTEAQAEPKIGVEVADSGIGMTPAQQARVCERFYRADTSGKILGTGLGMSIVKEIVELHGGELSIQSQFGVGTRVTAWIPLTAPES